METFSRNFIAFVFGALLGLLGTSNSANILFYFGLSTYSHRVGVWPLVQQLADRGHNITFVSPYLPKNPHPKVIEICPQALHQMMVHDVMSERLEHRIRGSVQADWEVLGPLGLSVCQIVLTSPEIQQWITKKPNFDLVFIDALFNECGLGFVHKFQSKFILYSTTSVMMWFHDMVGNVPESSCIPEMNYFYKEPMNFFQRVHNTIIPLYWHFWLRHTQYFPSLDELVRKELQIPEMPPIKELASNASLVFLTTHHSIEYARSLPPIYVPVGGMHIVESKTGNGGQLSQEMEEFMKHSSVIYVSFGSAANPSKFPTQFKSVLYKMFTSFSGIRFIWKFDSDDRPNDLPANVMTAKWVLQQEVLAHPNVRGFITHGGQGSIQESIYYGVPMVLFPMFAEQDYNANLVEKNGCGIKLEIIGIQDQELLDAVFNLINDTRYKERILKLSELFKDRPSQPLETAIWWTEYILRNKDTSSLKPLSLHQTWYGRRLLDVWLFLFLLLTVLISILGCAVLRIC